MRSEEEAGKKKKKAKRLAEKAGDKNKIKKTKK
jgi:hypothetical protein